MRRFEGKVAIVTGAAGGIGRATAIRLAREGASLHLCDVAAEPVADRQARNPLSRGFDPMAARW